MFVFTFGLTTSSSIADEFELIRVRSILHHRGGRAGHALLNQLRSGGPARWPWLSLESQAYVLCLRAEYSSQQFIGTNSSLHSDREKGRHSIHQVLRKDYLVCQNGFGNGGARSQLLLFHNFRESLAFSHALDFGPPFLVILYTLGFLPHGSPRRASAPRSLWPGTPCGTPGALGAS